MKETIKYECGCGNRVGVLAESETYFIQKQVICIKCSKQMWMNWTPRPTPKKSLAEELEEVFLPEPGYGVDSSTQACHRIAKRAREVLLDGKEDGIRALVRNYEVNFQSDNSADVTKDILDYLKRES